jgi:hypothetical protein
MVISRLEANDEYEHGDPRCSGSQSIDIADGDCGQQQGCFSHQFDEVEGINIHGSPIHPRQRA